jgi:hypothetical protein
VNFKRLFEAKIRSEELRASVDMMPGLLVCWFLSMDKMGEVRLPDILYIRLGAYVTPSLDRELRPSVIQASAHSDPTWFWKLSHIPYVESLYGATSLGFFSPKHV